MPKLPGKGGAAANGDRGINEKFSLKFHQESQNHDKSRPCKQKLTRSKITPWFGCTRDVHGG